MSGNPGASGFFLWERIELSSEILRGTLGLQISPYNGRLGAHSKTYFPIAYASKADQSGNGIYPIQLFLGLENLGGWLHHVTRARFSNPDEMG